MSGVDIEIEKIEAQARDWFMLQQERPLTESEQLRFNAWLQLDQQNSQSYQLLENIWQGLGEIDTDSLQQTSAEGTGSWINRCLSFVSELLSPVVAMPKYAGAAFASFLLVSMLWFSGVTTDYPQEYQSKVGELQSLALDDGTKVTLGADSHIEFELFDDRRMVRLIKGQAFFDVAKDPHKPFYVDAGRAGVMVVGTRFEVYKQLGSVKISVEEGVVKVAPLVTDDFLGAKVKTLTAGKQVSAKNHNLGDIEEIDESLISPWREGRLVYRDAVLSDVVFDINRYRQSKIVLGSDSLKKLKVTTSLSVDQTDSVVTMLEQSLPVVAHQETEDRILILPKSSLL